MSVGNFISISWTEQVKSFLENLEISRQRPTKKSVHDLRVAIKKIRSYLRLKEFISGEIWQEQFIPIKSLFKISGKLRDYEISITLLAKYQKKEKLLLPSFKNFLHLQKSDSYYKTKTAMANFKEMKFRQFNKSVYSSLIKFTDIQMTEKINEFAVEILIDVSDYSDEFRKNAHAIRKLLKTLYYLLIVCPDKTIENKIELTDLNEILTHLGNWQDGFIFQKKIKYYRKNKPDRNKVETETIDKLINIVTKNQVRLIENCQTHIYFITIA